MNYEIRTPRGKASHSHNLTMRNKYLDSSFCINTVQNVIPFLRKKARTRVINWQTDNHYSRHIALLKWQRVN